MSDQEQTTGHDQIPPAPDLNEQIRATGGSRRNLLVFGVAALAVVLAVTVWMLSRPKGGLYGQVLVNNEPARRVQVALLIKDEKGGSRLENLKTDSQGYYKIPLHPGSYSINNPGDDPLFLKIGNESLEIIRKGSPLGINLKVAEALTDVRPIRVGRPGRILGPLEGAIIMPDEKFSWVPYPNAGRYVIELLYFDTASRAASSQIYVDGELGEWTFAISDDFGRPLGTEAFRVLNPRHPSRSMVPGGLYRWTLQVFNDDGTLKTTSKPISFSVSTTDEAHALVASREAASLMELNRKMGVLSGRITKTGIPVRNASFHITIDRVERESGQRRTIPYLAAQTDAEGGFEIPLEAGVYSVAELRPQPGDTILDAMQAGAILVPGAPAAIYEVNPGQRAVLPDIQIVGAVKVKYPKNGQKNVDRKPTIEWEKFEDANRYQLTLHYLGDRGQRSAILIVVTNQTSYDVNRVSLPPELGESLEHPLEGLKPGGHYSYQILASKEPEQKLIFDRNKPPPQWIRMSESDWTDFYVKK